MKQTIRILRGDVDEQRWASILHRHGACAATFTLFARVSTAANMPPGSYQVESVMTLGGRSYRQTTPFTVR